MIPNPFLEIPLLRGPVPLSHLLLRQFVRPGDTAVDATCGNGNDTLLLAELVGVSGRVWAFDIQEDAVAKTAGSLAAAGLSGRVEIIRSGHECMAEHIGGGVGAVIFNLGYLPGGDRTVITRPETTLSALEQALDIVKPGGILAVTVYPGHDGGGHERRTVDAWATARDPRRFHSWRMGQVNVPTTAPYFIMIQKAL